MPKLQRTGKLEGVIYVEINSDEQPALAGKLMRGNSIPQLVVFYQDDSGWRRSQLTGAHGESQVESLVKRAVTAQSEAKDSEKSREVASGGE